MRKIYCLHRWEHYYFSSLDRPAVRCAICHQQGDPYATLQEMQSKEADYPPTVIGKVEEQ